MRCPFVVRDILDDEIPSVEFFSRVAWSLCVAYDVIVVLASVGLIAGTTSRKRYFLVPWLTVVSLSLLFALVLVLAAMIGQGGSRGAFFIFLFAAPAMAAFGYCWMVVYSAFHQLRNSDPTSAPTCDRRPESAPLVPPSVAADADLLFLGGGGARKKRRMREVEEEETSGVVAGTTASSCSIEDEEAAAAAALMPILENPSSSREAAETTENTTASLLDDGRSPTTTASDDLLLVTTAEIATASAATRSESSSSLARSASLKSSSSSSSSEVTPPPAYDAVREDINKERMALESGLVGSQDLIFFNER